MINQKLQLKMRGLFSPENRGLFNWNIHLVDAINLGQAFRYMEKPWDHDKLKRYIEDAYEVYKENKEQEDRIKLLERTNEELKITLNKKSTPKE